MTSLIQRFLTAEAALFGGAALMHAGFLIRGHEHWKAASAESVIAFVLLAGLVATFVATIFVPLFFVVVARRRKTRRAAVPVRSP